jgi:hypothetical protein
MRWAILSLLVIAAFALVAADEATVAVSAVSEVGMDKPKPAVKPAVKLRKPAHKKKKARKPKKPAYVGGDVLFNRAMNVRGVMAAGSLVANNATIKGTLITRQLKTKHIRAHTVSAGELKTTRLSSPTGTIVIEGDLLITHSRALEFGTLGKHLNATKKTGHKKGKKGAKNSKKIARGMSFLAEDVVIGGVRQWSLVRSDRFTASVADNEWRLVGSEESGPIATTVCEKARSADRFLGGHCQLANGPVRKEFKHLPPHTELRMTARYHFIDNWKGETAYATLDDSFVWTQTHCLGPLIGGVRAGLQLCGSDRFPETRLSSPIDVSAGHSADSVTIAFGAHSAEEALEPRALAEEQKAACERSFGVDDVELWVR